MGRLYNAGGIRRFLAFALILSLSFTVTACGGNKSSSSNSDSNNKSNSSNSKESQAQVKADGNVLVAYFTAAENSGVDAVASASYSEVNGEAVGRVRALADMIQAKTGGELFSIQTSVVYPADGGELIDYAQKEQDDNARPELTSHIENLDNYNTIFIGFPTWWYDMPQVLYSFFDEYDFSGKTIIPFNTHNGSRFSGTIDTIKDLEPDADVITDGLTISEHDIPEAEGDVNSWLEGLGY